MTAKKKIRYVLPEKDISSLSSKETVSIGLDKDNPETLLGSNVGGSLSEYNGNVYYTGFVDLKIADLNSQNFEKNLYFNSREDLEKILAYVSDLITFFDKNYLEIYNMLSNFKVAEEDYKKSKKLNTKKKKG